MTDPDERKRLEEDLAEKAATLAQFEMTVDPDLLRLVSDAAVAAAEWAQQLKQMEATLQLERDFLPKLAADGWLLSPSGPVDQPERLYSVYQDGGIAAVDRHLIGRLDAEACRVIVHDVTTKRTVFTAWIPTFDKALAALERGDHELAIPIWLAALEFACRQEFGVRDVFSKTQSRDAVEAKLASLATGYGTLAIAWLKVLLGFSGKGADRGPAVLNRHAVMHGERPSIGNRKDALQCLLALEVLSYLLDERDRAAARRPV